ncbi:hypothetical protein RBI22_23840 [Alcaligenaceae bacterium C4P045]|nr:hypothetical protein [Alcaligenaceae bacterium B3P038]MDQ2151739.1 hypothetical protein [Alcaligenaceae bacterium C4P045]
MALLFLALVSGCASSGSGSASGADASPAESPKTPIASATNACKGNRNACKYEGAYERGEANYAELEAKRLNQTALQRFRDSMK